MPANLSPEYKAAEAGFRKARTPKERLEWLREMLRTIPKHKGTDHLQGDIKSRIKELTEELAGPKKGGARHGPAVVVHPEGAAQVALLGPPNSGKSTLHARLTNSGAQTGPYPFTTQFPQAGMLPFEDVHLQLVDLPPVSEEHPVPWLAAALQSADAALLVVDLGDPECVEQVQTAHRLLAEKRVFLNPRWDHVDPDPESEELDPFALHLPTLMVITKTDLLEDLEGELAVFRELTGADYPVLALSAESGAGLEAVGPWLFRALGVVRVYTKTPGQPAHHDHPFALRRGQTVGDVAQLVHHDIAEHLKYARVWEGDAYDGRQVGRDHPLVDGVIVELHT